MACKITSLYIDDALYRDVKIYCATHNISIKEFVTEAIIERLKK